MIEVDKLSRHFKVHIKKPGLRGSMNSLFKREYREKIALHEVSFKASAGEIVGLVGANGAGKTTLVKILSGIVHPTSGDARICGHRPWERKNEYRKQLALIMGQKAQLWWDLPAMDSFQLLKEIYQIPKAQFNESIEYLADHLRIRDQLNIQVRRLSLGERMKVELMACLLHRPKVVFLDEPTIGLDITAQKAVREFISDYQKEFRPVTILTSHYMEDIEQLCKRLIIIRDGSFVYDGALSEISAHYMKERIITLHLDHEAPQIVDNPNLILIEKNDLNLKYKVKYDDLRASSIWLLNNYPVKDLSIEETPIGDIIERMMLGQGKGDRVP